MSRMKSVAISIVVCAIYLVAVPIEQDEKGDQNRFQGEWMLVKSTAKDGASVGNMDGFGLLVAFDEKQFCVKSTDGKIIVTGRFELDMKQDPKHLDLYYADEPVRMIYKFDGNKLITAEYRDVKNNKKRPSSFESKDADPIVINEMVRRK
jgi:uncharacterized protein (TIGR03067 family)